jgi:hypothetical protein
MTIYSYNGAYPQKLPFRIRLSDGRTRTDPTSFTAEEIADAGYTPVADTPSITDSQVLEWDSQAIDWIVRDKTAEEIAVELATKKTRTLNSITGFRDELIASGFWFNGVKYDSRPEDQKRISGAALLAFMAVSQGAEANNYLWHGGTDPFSWIAQDNTVVQMDAPTVISFGQTAAEHERAHIFAARALKDMDPIPDDWANTAYWPVSNEPVDPDEPA